MRKAAWIFLFFLPILVIYGFKSPPTAAAQGTIAPSIFMQSPREGQALQGVEIIEGKIRGDAFIRGKIAFSYAGAAEPTWFFIADLIPQVDDSAQTSFVIEWDTAQITDGNYDLRVVAEYGGGAAIFELIPNLRIRNHSPVETTTPGPVSNESEIDFTPTTILEPTTASTPTPLAPNPAVVQSNDLYQVLKISGIGVVVLFIVGFIYWQVKNRDR
ncbi:MAG: hypothetical protein MUP11_06060 [Anaerolineales bacterium]|nr:hypothetical protein [Anaerolineales bacterium]